MSALPNDSMLLKLNFGAARNCTDPGATDDAGPVATAIDPIVVFNRASAPA
jgi:hypothetical protein